MKQHASTGPRKLRPVRVTLANMKLRPLIITFTIAWFCMADQAMILVDMENGDRSDPFIIHEGAVIQIGDSKYRVERDQNLDQIHVPTIEFDNLPIRDAITRMLQDAIVPEGQSLPVIEVFRVPEELTLNLKLRNVSLKQVITLITERHDLIFVQSETNVFILQPSDIPNIFETRIYHIGQDTYDSMIQRDGTFEALLIRFGILSAKTPATVEYTSNTGRLVIRMPREAHILLRQHTINVTTTPPSAPSLAEPLPALRKDDDL